MKYFFLGILLFITLACKKERNNMPPEENQTTTQPAEEIMDPVSAKDAQMMSFFVEDFPTDLVQPRNVEVWFPASYAENPEKRYPVLYMQDGQNVFNPETSTHQIPWAADKIAQKLMDEGKIKETIIVAIWSTDNRFGDYMPAKPFKTMPQKLQEDLLDNTGNVLKSDAYIKFIFEDLKPYIDGQFRTLADRDNTYIMGSSMGGLISLYAICEYASIFGGAACVSTHWPVSLDSDAYEKEVKNAWTEYLQVQLPDPKTHKIWFDYGTATLDAKYEPYQMAVNDVMKEKGYVEGKNWVTQKYPGAEHNEQAWQDRLDDILTFLLKK